MKIQATKTFCKFINDTAKEAGVKLEAAIVKLSPRSRELHCGMESTWIDSPDYDWSAQTFNTICIVYPWEYYAGNRYLSTEELVDEYRRAGVNDWDGLKKFIVDLLAI